MDNNTSDSSTSRRHTLSPRRRRLRMTLVICAACLVLGSITGWVLYVKNRTAAYVPGETSRDVTSELARNLPAGVPKPRFTDVTRQAGMHEFGTFIGDRTSQLPEDNGPGLAWGDFDNDGDDDLFLVSAGGPLSAPTSSYAPCQLYENLGNGRFRSVTTFPDTRIIGMGAAWGDYDEDGFLDVVVTGYNALLLFRNENGTGRFTLDPQFGDRPGYWAGAAWGDFDNDRHLDLYVCGYVQFVHTEADRDRISTQIGTAVPYTLNPASYQPGTNLLFHSRGDGTFEEVAAHLNVTNPEGRSLAALWHDFDDDGWLDLYVANDISDNVLYRNLGGTFQDISHLAHVADYRSAMGLAVGDFDRDGDDDLFVGHWVAQENGLYQNLLVEYRARATATNSNSATERRHMTSKPAGPRPPVQFLDVADMKGVGQIALPFVSWGAEFVDLDADGWLDLLVANGNTIEFNAAPPKRLKPQESFLFWNQRGEFFHNIAPLCPPLTTPRVSRGLAISDYDQDGDMDIVISHLGHGVQLLRNEMQTGRWLKLRLRSRLADGTSRGFGDGARVTAWVNGVALRRAITGVSYLSQSSRALHFGLGQATQVERLEVRWLGGGTNVYANLEADCTWEITEYDPTPERLGRARSFDTTAMPAPASGREASNEKEDVLAFWKAQRAAMDALKIEKDFAKAIPLFEAALRLNPRHQDSRYYLAQCFAAEARPEAALAQLEQLTRINPQSHRGFQQYGVIRAKTAKSSKDLALAEQYLEQAHRINPEETGVLLALGELGLIRKDPARAQRQLEDVCHTNHRAVGALFLRGYLAWKEHNHSGATNFLVEARQALGKEWQPLGTTSEGDVKRRQHVEGSLLSFCWETWDGRIDPQTAFAALETRLDSWTQLNDISHQQTGTHNQNRPLKTNAPDY